ncbi:hypothetical protein PAXRUDRAFT_16075 [Paxillus rubicundulus Ve08.2h10]|uniref:Uncharacterized protein n=1 Tax=Paxillus rubicundulus Ve08.2h10 TaxID=930991 RepID=A0A0D0DFP6_9AGAM|nr:hypothetical protein PAXRUDRAFT_16075 [Paxillus rubicundulus Ve08.2h10]
MEADGSKLEGKQTLDGNQGGKGGEKGKKKKEKKIERVAKGSNGGQESPAVGLDPPVTPSKRAPSLGPGPSPLKKAKAAVSKLRPKTASVTQKAKFTYDVGVTPAGSIKVYHPLAGPLPLSIPHASALELIATPVNPLLDP